MLNQREIKVHYNNIVEHYYKLYIYFDGCLNQYRGRTRASHFPWTITKQASLQNTQTHRLSGTPTVLLIQANINIWNAGTMLSAAELHCNIAPLEVCQKVQARRKHAFVRMHTVQFTLSFQLKFVKNYHHDVGNTYLKTLHEMMMVIIKLSMQTSAV